MAVSTALATGLRGGMVSGRRSGRPASITGERGQKRFIAVLKKKHLP